jgi:hypothetical protein
LIKNSVRINQNFSSPNSEKIQFLKTKVVFQGKKNSVSKNRSFYWRAKQEIQGMKKKLRGPKENSSTNNTSREYPGIC